MNLWIGIHLPQLPLEVFRPSWSVDTRSAVAERGVIEAVSPSARRSGIRTGMKSGGATLLSPTLQVYQRSDQLEAAAMDAVATALLQFSPFVAIVTEGTLLLDVGASLRLFGGIRSIQRLAKKCTAVLGFTSSIRCAPTARGAWLLSQLQQPSSVALKSLPAKLNRLPVRSLACARPHHAWFEGIGCFTLADLRRLPRAGLRRRCGAEILDVLDSAYGENPEHFESFVPPKIFSASLELHDRIDNAENLYRGAQMLIEQLTGWLSSQHLAAKSIRFLLHHERGRVARAPSVIEIRVSEPTWRAEHLNRLLKERLAQLNLDAPVINLTLETIDLHDMAPASDSLFPDPSADLQEQEQMLELIVSRLGSENVLCPHLVEDHRPEVANHWLPIQDFISKRATGKDVDREANVMARPTWMLAEPLQLLIRDERPFYGSPLKIVSGPERLEAGWWSEGQSRDYFVAQGNDNALYWVFLERATNTRMEAGQRWFLHGLFG